LVRIQEGGRSFARCASAAAISKIYLWGPWFESRRADGVLHDVRAQSPYRRYTSGVPGQCV
ncbi:MAG: hypothetical protein KGI66_01770, partial [Patescibacteria group bacterium]|nr:hypothetical protein [Patescibacteria group bacterium]